MAAQSAALPATHDNRLVLLAWAPPLLALCLLSSFGVAMHTRTLAREKAPVVATQTPALAGAGSAIMSNAAFH